MGTASARILDLIGAPFSWRRRHQTYTYYSMAQEGFQTAQRNPEALQILEPIIVRRRSPDRGGEGSNRSSFAEGLLTKAGAPEVLQILRVRESQRIQEDLSLIEWERGQKRPQLGGDLTPFPRPLRKGGFCPHLAAAG
jgi:hypothetical protein